MRQLRYFDALARFGHFGQAAAFCSVTQPALSVQIREMEALVGAPLIERATRQARLTALGEALAPRVRQILRDVDELGEVARAARAPFSGTLRLGVIPTVAPYLLPAMAREIAALHPALDLQPREAITPKLLQDLEEARLDAAILALPHSGLPALAAVELFEEKFILVRPPTEASRPVPGAAQLQEMRLLLLEEGHCFRDQALSFCKISTSRATRNVMEGNSLSTLVQMVGAGLGLTLVPETALPMETRATNLALARLPAPQPHRTIGMVWRGSSPLRGELAEIATIISRIGMETLNQARKLLPA